MSLWNAMKVQDATTFYQQQGERNYHSDQRFHSPRLRYTPPHAQQRGRQRTNNNKSNRFQKEQRKSEFKKVNGGNCRNDGKYRRRQNNERRVQQPYHQHYSPQQRPPYGYLPQQSLYSRFPVAPGVIPLRWGGHKIGHNAAFGHHPQYMYNTEPATMGNNTCNKTSIPKHSAVADNERTRRLNEQHRLMIQSFRRDLTIALLCEEFKCTIEKASRSYDPEWPYYQDVDHGSGDHGGSVASK